MSKDGMEMFDVPVFLIWRRASRVAATRSKSETPQQAIPVHCWAQRLNNLLAIVEAVRAHYVP